MNLYYITHSLFWSFPSPILEKIYVKRSLQKILFSLPCTFILCKTLQNCRWKLPRTLYKFCLKKLKYFTLYDAFVYRSFRIIGVIFISVLSWLVISNKRILTKHSLYISKIGFSNSAFKAFKDKLTCKWHHSDIKHSFSSSLM